MSVPIPPPRDPQRPHPDRRLLIAIEGDASEGTTVIYVATEDGTVIGRLAGVQEVSVTMRSGSHAPKIAFDVSTPRTGLNLQREVGR